MSNQFRFEEILEEIKLLTDEALSLLPAGNCARAESYWYSQIVTALDNDHGYLSGCMCSMQDTLNEWEEDEDEDEDEDEE
jgi:hypothetical protein